ncbi:probable imidazolonepropionase isoform X2 [Corticium candelabrum]|uniref:probable imidazolonepropionase isoform X2 n=1 Tax=Corticium candelabrum TaxID=121492 RepID=UPI002E26954D|nr:probable imidazolonepropionase isoform X2 [Corticium candelabrum]
MSQVRLIVRHARQIVQVCRNKEARLIGKEMNNVCVMTCDECGDEGLSLIISHDGLILDVGTDREIAVKYDGVKAEREINARNKSILPGFVDAHTHPVWAGDRVHEFAMKLAGASYMDVHSTGGGIQYTVAHTQQATETELYNSLKLRLRQMLSNGTTLIECKSGYGLDVDTEIKMLKVIERARRELDIGISATFCGAHSIPKGSSEEQAADNVINQQLPAVCRLMESKDLHVDSIDVFCEKGVFGLETTRRILEAGRDVGLALNFHGDELHPMEAGKLGAAMKARAVSHLEEVSHEGIKAMATAGTIAILLPTTAYILRLKQPPARQMIEEGVAVALGTDFNPNAYCMSMPLIMHLACVNMRITLNEALAASTINAAAALGKADTHGSLEVGKVGDIIIVDAPSV